MNKKEISYAVNHIDARYIQEADLISINRHTIQKKKSLLKKLVALAACFALCILLLIPATNVQAVYRIMYLISPKFTQALKPVQIACEDQGIRMEVISAYIYENEAKIYISMQDKTGERIDETTDLFDSYSINRPFSSSASCNKVDYDPETHTVTFLIHFTQVEGNKIEGDKITFSVSCFLSKKETYHAKLPIDLSTASLTPQVQTDVKIRGMSWQPEEEQPTYYSYLTPLSNSIYEPTPGVSITAMGFINGKLRIQTHYDNIHETDNHGFLTLKDKDGNKIPSEASVSFWDEQSSGSYDETIFVIEPEELNSCTIYGDFQTCSSITKGNWQVTFPLEIAEIIK